MNIAVEYISLFLLIIVAISLSKPLLRHSYNKQLLIVFVSVILLHSIISIGNGFYGPIYGADNDALRFHDAAMLYFDLNSNTDLLLPGWAYSIFLAYVYELTSYSWAIGGMLSTIVFAGLLVVSVHLYRTLSFDKSDAQISKGIAESKIIILVGLIPASIVLTSITMREVYQMFFLGLSVLFTAKYLQRKKVRYLVFMIFALLFFAGLHVSFKYYVFIYLMALFCFQLRKLFINANLKYKIILFTVTCSALLFLDVSIFHAIIYKFVEGTAGAEDSRAYYGLPEIAATLYSIVSFMFISFFNYMVRPFPWEMTSIVDILPFFENMMRLFFIWRIFQLKKFVTAPMAWVLFAALLLELLWGMGTLNWGTAQRHHLVAWPLFVVVYYAAVSKFKFIKSINTQNKLSYSSVAA